MTVIVDFLDVKFEHQTFVEFKKDLVSSYKRGLK